MWLEVEKCFNLPILECIPELNSLFSQENYRLFPAIVDGIFNPQLGWCLDLINYNEYPEECEAVFEFLKYNGLLFTYIEKLVANGNLFYNQDYFDCKVFPSSINAYEYYMLKFFKYLREINQLNNVDDIPNNFINSLYDELAQDYCTHILPIYHSNETQKLSRDSRNKHCSSTLEILCQNFIKNKCLVAHSLNIKQTNFLKTFFNRENYPQLIFIEAFVVVVLGWKNMVQSTIQRDEKESNIYLPSINELSFVKTILIHLFNFCELKSSCVLLDDTLNLSPQIPTESSTMCNSRTSENFHIFKCYLFPVYLRHEFYRYYQNLFSAWPFLPSFNYVFNYWLTFIQPWKYTNDIDEGGGPNRSLIYSWKNYVQANGECYSMILNLYILRIIRQHISNELTEMSICQQLYRVLKIFVRGDLHLILKHTNKTKAANHFDRLRRTAINHLLPMIIQSMESLEKNLSIIDSSTTTSNDISLNAEGPSSRPDDFLFPRNISLLDEPQYLLDELVRYFSGWYKTLSYEKRLLTRKLALHVYRLLYVRFYRNFLRYNVRYAYFSWKYRGNLGIFHKPSYNSPLSSSFSQDIDSSPLFIELMARGGTVHKNCSTPISNTGNNTIIQKQLRSSNSCSGNSSFSRLLKRLDVENTEAFVKEESVKSLKYLSESLRFVQIMFGPIDEKTLYSLKKMKEKSSNSYFERSGQHSTRNSKYDTTTLANSSELAPIRSYENSFLVRFFYHVSKYLTGKYQTRIHLIYLQPGIKNVLLRFVTYPFIAWKSSLDYNSPFNQSRLLSPRQIVRQPYINLRFLANYHFWGYIVFLALLLTTYGLTLNHILLWAIIIIVAISIFDVYYNHNNETSSPRVKGGGGGGYLYPANEWQSAGVRGVWEDTFLSTSTSPQNDATSITLLTFILFLLVCYLFYSLLRI